MRVLFHYTHKQTLGHTTRSITLTNALCEQGAQVLILQGGLPQPFVRFHPKATVLDIPEPFDDRKSFEGHTTPQSSGKRAQFILKAAAQFDPQVMVTEFFPFGRLAYLPELLPTLRFLRKKDVRIVASIGYPLIIDLDRLSDPTFAALHRAIFALYDQFLIHTPQALETPYIQESIQLPPLRLSYATLMKDLKKRINYTGYILPQKMMTGGTTVDFGNKGEITLLVSRGGGAVYPKLITAAIEAQRLLKPQVRTLIACGPATSHDEMKSFQALLTTPDKKRVVLAERIADFDEHLRRSSVSVSLCGYNTSVQLMRFGTPSIIVPYQNTSTKNTTNDQIARARLLKERFNHTVLDYDNLDGKTLSNAIKEQLKAKAPQKAPAGWFDGATTSAQLILAPNGAN